MDLVDDVGVIFTLAMKQAGIVAFHIYTFPLTHKLIV